MDNEKLTKIIRHFGAYPQISKAVEELIELAEILIKDINKGDVYKSHLEEEMADVTIMLSQLMIIYNIHPEELKEEIDRKIKRTLERVETDSKYVGDCESCRYTDKDTDEEPCKSCNHNNGNVNRYVQYIPKTDCSWKRGVSDENR